MNALPIVEFKSVSKCFGEVTANKDVSFSISENGFHGVVGENGAGKSTIMKLLYGLLQPDSGTIFLKDKPIRFRSPQEAIQQGIGMVHQHFMLVPTLTVWENIVLGFEPYRFRLDTPSLLKHLEELQTHFGFSLELGAKVEELPLGQQQQVEILKVLYRKAHILILDEPTAVLSPQEVEPLFRRLKDLQKQGKTIIVVTHKLKEILNFSDCVTVMRNGLAIKTIATTELNEGSLSQLIMGRERASLPKRKWKRSEPQDVLKISSVSTHSKTMSQLKNLNLTVQSGQILGLAGIEGQGQTQLVDALCQLEPFTGSISLLGSPLNSSSSYSKRQKGFSVIPPDRHKEGLLLDFSVSDNFLLGHQRESHFKEQFFLNRVKIRSFVEKRLAQFDVRPPNPDLPSRSLSGGNQQKLIIARETSQPVRFLLACHPTRGVDIGSIDFIHSHFLELADQGAGILLISTELDELLTLADSIAVIRDGSLVFQSPTEGVSLAELGLWMTGAKT